MEPGHHRRIDDRPETPFGQRRRDGARPDGRAGRGIPARRAWPRQPGLPPRRRSYRLDRSPVDRAGRPLTASRAPTYGPPPLRRRPAELPDPLEEVHAAHRSRRAQRHHSGAQGQQQEAGAAGAGRQGGRAVRARASAPSSKSCCSARSSVRPASATASPFRTASCQSSTSCSDCSRGSSGRSISRRSTASRSISCFCCWRRKAPAPIISRRWRAWRACCAMPRSPANCAIHAMPRRSMPCWRCRRRAPRNADVRRGGHDKGRSTLVLNDLPLFSAG